jgi:hypothetical protein
MEIRSNMKITLKRKVQLKSAIVYLKLSRDIKRDEIKDYLKSSISFPNEIVEKRVRNYLREKGIFNQQGQLTVYGIKVKETGLVKEFEEGKYQIWYIVDDPLFKNTIFHFVRIEPKIYDPEMKPVELDFSGKEFHSLPIYGKKDDKDSIKFSIVGTAKLGEEKADTNIDCTWIWNNTNSSSFVFAGKIVTSATNKDGKQLTDDIDGTKPVDFKIDLNQHINTIIPNWNKETRRCSFKFEDIEKLEDIKKNNIYQYFEYSGSRKNEGYDLSIYEKLPVEPYNPEEAVIWRDKIIEMELKKKYIHPDDFTGNINAINQKEGFSAYSEKLQEDVPDIKQYIDKLEHGKKSDRKLPYWHLAAPMDLNVNIPQSLQIDSFSLSKNIQICFRELADKFGKVTAEKIFYYDKYVVNYYQQRSVSAFLDCFGVSNICIITDTNQQDFDNYLTKNKPSIAVEDIGSVFQNQKDAPHDRFIVFKHGNNLVNWTSTNSIDFIRFKSQGNINPADSGTIFQSVTFTKVKQNVLGKPLENFIMRG